MKIEEIRNRIEKKEQEVGKLVAKFDKYSRLVSEEFLALVNQYLRTGDFAPIKEYRIRRYPNSCMLNGSDYDLYAAANDLYNARATLSKYHKQLEAEVAKENTINEMPEVLVEFTNNLINRWDDFDAWKKNRILEEYKNQPRGIGSDYREWQHNMREKWGNGWYDFMHMTQEQIHKANVQAAESIVLNLLNRTVEIAGKITDCQGLRIDQDNAGYSIINGLVIGEKGKARVESIGAGGYNIQRYHIRVLVKEVK